MKNYPVIKSAILFTAGIVSYKLFQINLIIFFVLAAVVVLLYMFHSNLQWASLRALFLSLLVSLLIIFAGNIWYGVNDPKENKFFDEIHREKNITLWAEIDNVDLIKNDNIVFYVLTDSIRSDRFFVEDKIKFLCKINGSKNSLAEFYSKLHPGYSVELKGTYYKGREERNPGEFDYDAYLKSKGITGIIYINNFRDVKILSHNKNLFNDFIFSVRKFIDEKIYKYHSLNTAALLRGLLLADRGEISYETKTEFINSGVIHVLAVSGLHVGYIALIFLLLFGRLNIFLRSIITIAGLFLFMIITGVPPSVFRATVMAIIIIIAFLTNRSTNLFNSLAIAALIILAINPAEIYNPGFQLSFAAVLSIAVIYPLIEKKINEFHIKNKSLRYILLFIGVSLSAQIGTLPLTLIYFGKVSLIALLTNLMVIPAIGVIIAVAIFTIIVSTILPFLAVYFASANDLFSFLMLSLISYSGQLSFSHLVIYRYSIIDAFVFYTFVSVFIYFFNSFKNRIAKLILFSIIIFNIVLYSSVDDEELLPENYLNVVMIDIGQGDSFLIKFPNGKTALIDAGNVTINFDNGERVIKPLLGYLGIDKIDYAIVSHIDSDHYAGFVSLIQKDLIERIYKPAIDSSITKDVKFEKFIRDKNIPVMHFSRGTVDIGNCRLYILNNNFTFANSNVTSNNLSGLIKLVYGNTSFLFTGDIETKMENFYVNQYHQFLKSDVLKVAHHGSKTSTSKIFLEYVHPKIALVSAGVINQFNHPAKEIIERLKNAGSKIFRTDKEGAVLLRSDGYSIHKIKWNEIKN